jgi:hypothetical protein
MGEWKQHIDADGSWAHAPDEEAQVGSLPPGPFGVSDMPFRKPAPPPVPEKTRKLLRGVPGSTGGEEE